MIKVKVVKKSIKVEAYRIGLPGSVWRNGTGVPANTLGIDRDYYLENVTGNVYARTAGIYTLQTNIMGPAGINTWGSITGNLSNQTDLVNALAAKYDASNPTGYITGINNSMVLAALGYTPYNATNPAGYISSVTSGMVTTALGFTPYNTTNPAGYISGITSGMVTTALGYTPYNATNPAGYITNSALTPYGILANPLNQFASTTSAQLAGIISDETGSGSLVFNTNPQFLNSVNIGNASVTNQKMLRVGQDTAFIDIGSLSGLTSWSSIYFNQTTPSATNYHIAGNASTLSLNAPNPVSLISLQIAAVSKLQIFDTSVVFSPGPSTNSAVKSFEFTSPNNTNQTLSTAIPKVLYTLGSTEWATGALPLQKFFEVTAPTVSFVGTSTATNVYTMYINAPIVGTFAAITNSFGIGTNGNIQAPKIQSATGNFTVEAVSGNTLFRSYGNQVALIGINTANFTPVARGSGAGSIFAFAPPANTNQTASTEIFGFVYSAGNQQWATGNITTQREFYIAPRTYSFIGTSSIANAFGIYVDSPIAGTFASITNNYAAGFAGNILLATNNKAIYGKDSAGTDRKLLEFTSGDNINIYGKQGTSDVIIDPTSTTKYFILKNSGSIGIYGVASPTANLHIGAASGSGSGKAPLKYTSGAVMTTPEAGASEYNNTFHLTNSDAVRRHIVLAPTGTKITAAAPYANDGYVIINIGGTDIKIMTTA